jgi:hypothetical protein
MILLQGKNKGKVCSEASKICRHKSKACQWCNKIFDRDTTCNNHEKICVLQPKVEKTKVGRPTIKVKVKVKVKVKEIKEVKEVKVKVETNANIRPEQEPHPKPAWPDPDQDKDRLLETMCSKINTMEASIQKLTSMLIEVSAEATAPKTIINNIQINISDIGAFKNLCEKMGASEATDFLCQLASKPKIITLFEKLYLDGNPTEHPIATLNGKDFVYRDINEALVHDIGGTKISELGERLLKNTFIEAVDPILTRFVRQNQGDRDGDDNDYDTVRELQNGACLAKKDKTFIKDLSTKVYNPNHSFFVALCD